MNRTAQIILYILTALIAFVFFVVLLFPLDSVIGYYLGGIEKATKGVYRVSVSEIDASLVFDTQFSNFRVYENGVEIFSVPKLEIGFSLFSLLGETKSLSFEAYFKKGEIDGRFSINNQGINVVDISLDEVNIDDLSFFKYYLEKEKIPIQLKGVLDGSFYVYIDNDPKASEAEINLKILRAHTTPMPIKALNQTIPKLNLSKGKKAVVFDCVLENGRIRLKKFIMPGPDLSMDLSGSARLNRRAAVNNLSFDGKFSLSDKITAEIPMLGDMLAQHKNADGSFPLTIRGSGKKPKIKVGDFQISDFFSF
jgi:type II secretion system protein N